MVHSSIDQIGYRHIALVCLYCISCCTFLQPVISCIPESSSQNSEKEGIEPGMFQCLHVYRRFPWLHLTSFGSKETAVHPSRGVLWSTVGRIRCLREFVDGPSDRVAVTRRGNGPAICCKEVFVPVMFSAVLQFDTVVTSCYFHILPCTSMLFFHFFLYWLLLNVLS